MRDTLLAGAQATMNFREKLATRGIMCLDGALASELEARGCDLNQRLWSAAILHQNPELISAVHRDYLVAGADCIASSSYQASLPGFAEAGFDAREGEGLYRLSIRLAFEARDDFCRARGVRVDSPEAPLVAVSIGPYGAYLADGSEYRGNYGISDTELRSFHAERLELAIDELGQLTDRPLLAFETIPCLGEAKILTELLNQHPEAQAWLAFSCNSTETVSEGQSITSCVAALQDSPGLVALGVNCTDPALMPELIPLLAQGNLPVISYPNSGASYDSELKLWCGPEEELPLDSDLDAWSQAGASILGGCCRTTPAWIAQLVAWREAR
ncbi:MAG: homocysteine S-methyltransferase [Planctomycetota bacterium]|jgi:homocysteine S-methyltransferase